MTNPIVEQKVAEFEKFVVNLGSAFRSALTTALKEQRGELVREMASQFRRVWHDKFGYEVILWNKEQGTPISCHGVIDEALSTAIEIITNPKDNETN